jgi:polar amino acid transport system substrate-binding protein
MAMGMRSAFRLAAVAVLLAAAGAGASTHALPILRIVAPTNQSMPLLAMDGKVPTDGLLKDLGELLAQRLGMNAIFVPLPSKRAGPAVAIGAADLLCYVKPGWLDGPLLWTVPFLAGAGVIAAGPQTPSVARLQDLQGERLGTVLGYRYPVIDKAFKQPLLREDVADADTNLRRLALGRVRYAVTDRATLAYFVRTNPDSELREVLTVEDYQLGCALRPDRPDLLPALNKAVAHIQADGALEALLARYR